MQRRGALAALGGIALGAACKAKNQTAPQDGPKPPAEVERMASERARDWRELEFPPSEAVADGCRALVFVPEAAEKAPLLIALHGRGESGNGLAIGARAWPYEYELDRLVKRIEKPPLLPSDLLDVVDPERLARINASLAAKPYAGLTIACPYAPWQPEAQAGYERFVVETLLPRVREEAASKAPRDATGIDGVSMGGRLALLIGLKRPDVFGVVGALQPAMRVEEGPMWSELAQKAMRDHPVKLRLVTSTNDVFRAAVEAVAKQLETDGVPHELLIIPGDHGYTFNRGPGGIEMLYWHSR